MKAFHNDSLIKDKYVARVRGHQLADNLIRGLGWNGSKGCAVGCTLENYDHSAYETELGIPEWLAHVEDALFEGMTEEKSRTWPEEFLEAIPVGLDLDPIKGPFLVLILERALTSFDHEKFPDVKNVLMRVIDLWKKSNATEQEFTAAAWAAWAAAEAAAWAEEAAWAAKAASRAAKAAEAAANAAKAAEAAAWAEEAEAVKAAAWAAWAAAEAAAWAVWAAAAEAVYDYFADELLKLIRTLGEEK